MQLGMIGLGRMGANLVRRLMRDGHECVVYDVNPDAVKALAGEGADRRRPRSRSSSASSSTPRAVWIMVPAAVVDATVERARAAARRGRHRHRRRQLLLPRRHRRARRAAPSGIHYVDVGTSGGVFGLERGFCLMIGGEDDVVAAPRPDLRHDRARRRRRAAHPGSHRRAVDRRERLPPLRPERRRPLREDGPQRHRVRAHGRVRRGPQHPQARQRRQARRATTTPRRRRCATRSYYQYDLDIPDVAEVWRRGSVVASWLLDLTAHSLSASRPTSPTSRAASPTPARVAGRSIAAIDEGVPAPVLTTALYERFTSRGEADFADKVLSAMRKEFGGHDEKTDVGETKWRSRVPLRRARVLRRDGRPRAQEDLPRALHMVKRGDLDIPVIGVASSQWTVDQLRDRAARRHRAVRRRGRRRGTRSAASPRCCATSTATTATLDTFTAARRRALGGSQRPAHYLAIPPQPVPDRGRGARRRRAARRTRA